MTSNRIKMIKPSMTVELTDKLTQMRRDGIDVIGLNIGEPDFNTPPHIIEAAKQAMDDGFTKYTVVSGVLELRESICQKLQIDNGLLYEPNEIIVTSGAKQALTNALLTICDKDDEVIIITPSWVSYIEMVKLADAVPVLVAADEDRGFRVDLDRLKGAITPKTKAILINTPNNPTGAVYSMEELRAIGEIAIRNNLYVISDEIYEKLVYDDAKHISIGSLSDEIWEKTITINGLSKAYAMTGWRLGYAAAPRHIVKGMNALQGHMTSATNSIAQKAGVAALRGPQENIEIMRKSYDERRIYLLKALNQMDGIVCPDVKGTFYLLPKVSSFYGYNIKGRKIEDSMDFANYILDEARIAVVPGAAFQAPNHIRIAYSNSLENIKEAMDRMERALEKLRRRL